MLVYLLLCTILFQCSAWERKVSSLWMSLWFFLVERLEFSNLLWFDLSFRIVEFLFLSTHLNFGFLHMTHIVFPPSGIWYIEANA